MLILYISAVSALKNLQEADSLYPLRIILGFLKTTGELLVVIKVLELLKNLKSISSFVAVL